MTNLSNTTQSHVCKLKSDFYTVCENHLPESKYRFMYRHYGTDEYFTDNFMRYDAFLIVMNGEIELTINEQKCLLTTGDIMVIPIFSIISFRALTDVDVFTHTFKIELNHHCMNRKLNKSYVLHYMDSTALSTPIKATPALCAFVDSLRFLLDRIPNCENLYRSKSFELGMFMAADYNVEDLHKLFHPLYRLEYRFILDINYGLEHFVNVADMAEWLEMNISDFEEKFSRVFNEKAEVWLERQRIHIIRQYVTTYKCSVKELTLKFSFCSSDHFESFCSK